MVRLVSHEWWKFMAGIFYSGTEILIGSKKYRTAQEPVSIPAEQNLSGRTRSKHKHPSQVASTASSREPPSCEISSPSLQIWTNQHWKPSSINSSPFLFIEMRNYLGTEGGNYWVNIIPLHVQIQVGGFSFYRGIHIVMWEKLHQESEETYCSSARRQFSHMASNKG